MTILWGTGRPSSPPERSDGPEGCRGWESGPESDSDALRGTLRGVRRIVWTLAIAGAGWLLIVGMIEGIELIRHMRECR